MIIAAIHNGGFVLLLAVIAVCLIIWYIIDKDGGPPYA